MSSAEGKIERATSTQPYWLSWSEVTAPFQILPTISNIPQLSHAIINSMEDDGKTYILPHHIVSRIILTCAGLFALIMAPYELWRGVWPLNITSPFFGFLILGGMTVGAGVLSAGFIAPSGKLIFERGFIIAERHFLWGKTKQVFRNEEISSISIRRQDQSDGPDDWYAIININGAPALNSRPLGSEAAAQKLMAEFQRLTS